MTRGVAGRQLQLLSSARDFRLLFAAAAASGIGTRLAVTALLVDVWDRTESGKWVAALLIADFVPTIVIGLLLGSLVDRLSRKRLMIGSDVIRLLVFCALPFAGSAAAVVALAGVVGFANGFFRPAAYAAMPNLVHDDDLPNANGLFQAGENVTWMVGPLFAGVLLTFSGPDLAYWINALTFLVSALLIARIVATRLQAVEAETHGHWRDLAEGFSLVVRERALLTVVVAWSVVMLGNASVDVSEVKLAKEAFDAGNFGLGLLMGAGGLGLLAGSLVAGWFTERRGVTLAYGGALALMAVGIALAAASPTVWVAAAFVVAFGFGNGVALVASALLVQRGAPDQMRGRAFTVIMSVNYAVFFVGMVIAGLLTDAIGARGTWAFAAAVTGVAALCGLLLGRGVGAAPPAEPVPVLPVVSGAAPEVGAVRD